MEKYLQEILKKVDYFDNLSKENAIQSDERISSSKSYYLGKAEAYQLCSFYLKDLAIRLILSQL